MKPSISIISYLQDNKQSKAVVLIFVEVLNLQSSTKGMSGDSFDGHVTENSQLFGKCHFLLVCGFPGPFKELCSGSKEHLFDKLVKACGHLVCGDLGEWFSVLFKKQEAGVLPGGAICAELDFCGWKD
ncbi:hypothetical protein Ancab_011117 [Ancistrocladus abbreviatus]